MKRGSYYERGGYPVDSFGFPVPVWDTDVPYIESEIKTNHHYDFCARTFGRLAISQTFRELQSQQIMLPDTSHQILHHMYTGMRMPHIPSMLDRIEEAQYTGEKLQVRLPNVGYELQDITDELLNKLYREYNNL